MTHKERNHIYFEEQCWFLTMSRASSFLGVFPSFCHHSAFPCGRAGKGAGLCLGCAQGHHVCWGYNSLRDHQPTGARRCLPGRNPPVPWIHVLLGKGSWRARQGAESPGHSLRGSSHSPPSPPPALPCTTQWRFLLRPNWWPKWHHWHQIHVTPSPTIFWLRVPFPPVLFGAAGAPSPPANSISCSFLSALGTI